MFKNFFSLINIKDKKRIIKNFYSQINLNLFGTFVQFLFPPLMITAYGLETFGIWIFLLNIPNTIAILNINLNEGSRLEMSMNYVKKKYKYVNKVFVNSSCLIVCQVIFFILVTICFLNFYSFDLQILSSFSPDYLIRVIIFVFLSFFINLLNNIFINGITFFGRIDINTYLEIFFDTFSKLLIILIGFYYKDILIASVALFLTSLIKILVYYYFFSKTNYFLNLFEAKIIEKKEMLRLIKVSFPHYINAINFLIRNSLQIMILGIFFNAQIVGMVSTLKTIFYFFPIKIWSIPLSSFNFEFTKLLSIKKFIIFKKIFSNLIKTYFVYCALLVSISLLFGKIFFSFWLNDSYNINQLIIFLIVMDVSILLFGNTYKEIGICINKFSPLINFNFLINCLIIFVSIIFFKFNASFYYLFYINIIGSLAFAVYSVIYTKKIIN